MDIKCDECGQVFDSEKGMKNHRTKVHSFPPETYWMVRNDLRERADYRCEDCGLREENSSVIHGHHIDRDRYNNSLDNLAYLCPSCHKYRHLYGEDFQENPPEWWINGEPEPKETRAISVHRSTRDELDGYKDPDETWDIFLEKIYRLGTEHTNECVDEDYV